MKGVGTNSMSLKETSVTKGKVKGYLFEHSFSFVHKHWGQDGVERFPYRESDYISERWYPLEDFCELLSEIHKTFGREMSKTERMGYESIVGDIRWRTLFKGMDPAELLISRENQDNEYLCGEFNFKLTGTKEVEIRLSVWIDDPDKARLWSDYYKGRLLGVLELTGHKGEVDMGDLKEEGKLGSVFHIQWK